MAAVVLVLLVLQLAVPCWTTGRQAGRQAPPCACTYIRAYVCAYIEFVLLYECMYVRTMRMHGGYAPWWPPPPLSYSAPTATTFSVPPCPSLLHSVYGFNPRTRPRSKPNTEPKRGPYEY
jgi:hypothetical protein